MSIINLLLDIQKNHDKINESNKILKDGTYIYLLKKMKNDFEDIKFKYKENEKQIHEIKNEYLKISIITNDKKKEHDALEFELYNNAGSDIKKINAIQLKIDECNKILKEYDDQSMVLLEKEDKLSAESEILRVKLAEIRTDFNEYKAVSNKKINDAKKAIEKAKHVIEIKEKEVPEQLMREFNKIKEIKGSGAAVVEKGVCKGCKMKVSALTLDEIKKGQNIVYCDNCGRILFCDIDNAKQYEQYLEKKEQTDII
jgi:uncharacterized protein